ncbi:hypothetical protein TrVE_jg8756 [Triparma verrucosa]|uniref:Uncharacterized protein n=1 Tax=Triparma verrucosa TaxID=1606542 RepID=A0A9W6ZAY3_9STRA|nr:hypothetical protein TrVE_jg8756 [Triparma verrucosa]
MFGDTFGTKSDYVKGMEYSMRRAYMGDEPGQMSSCPPDTLFVSRDQARKLNSAPDLEGHDDLDHILSFHSPSAKEKKKALKKKTKKKRGQYHNHRSSGVHFNKNSISDDSDSDSEVSPTNRSPVMALMAGRMATSPKSKAQMMKDNATKNKERKSKEKKATFTLEETWEKTHQAGCTFYVNRFTGEATQDDPFDVRPKKFDELKIVEQRIKDDVSPPLATGYGVYEELKPEFDKVMAFLDGKAKTYA